VDRSPDRIARAGLSRVVEPGDPTAMSAFEGLSPVETWAALRRGGEALRDWAARVAAARPDRDLDTMQSLGGRFVIPGDDEWPEQIDVLGQTGEVNRRGGLPFGLWVRGPSDLRTATGSRSVALVGARACTSYGEHVSGELAAGLADKGVTVLSGGAYGIDAAAHRGALAASGVTVAVLFDRIAGSGLVVSELPPGCSPTRLRFLARNRLIAALTDGTVVVEAAVRSGALNTASWADRCHRAVMAVPGPVTSATSHGAHILVRERGAVLVTGVPDVVEAISPMGEQLTAYPRGAERATDRLSDLALRVLDAVPVLVAVPEQNIGLTAGLAGESVRAGLVELTRSGLVEQIGSSWRLSAARREQVG
jgi:DNA processing protein